MNPVRRSIASRGVAADSTGARLAALQAGTAMLYGAMFDEVDEGTAMFKVAATRSDAPEDVPLVTLDVDGERLPSDST